jgi:nucleoside-diphosphate-sugar epimerase
MAVRVLVTGAGGFIGHHMVKYLVVAQHAAGGPGAGDRRSVPRLFRTGPHRGPVVTAA